MRWDRVVFAGILGASRNCRAGKKLKLQLKKYIHTCTNSIYENFDIFDKD